MRQSLKLLATAAALASGATTALAATLYTPPLACEVFMTVQLKNCEVANYYRCAGDAPGDTSVTYADSNGPFYSSRIDRETRWLESLNHADGTRDFLDAEAADHASLTALLDTGRDDFDFTTTSTRGETRHYVGHDELTGETVQLGGMTLDRTRFDLSSYDAMGNKIWRRTGNQYVSRDLRVFFSGTETFENAYGDVVETDDRPVRFAFPGQPGFSNASPEFGCDMMMTEAAPRLTPAPAGYLAPKPTEQSQ